MGEGDRTEGQKEKKKKNMYILHQNGTDLLLKISLGNLKKGLDF